MRGAEQAVVHLNFCKACVQKSYSRVRVPKQHAPACVAEAGPWGAVVNQQRRRGPQAQRQKQQRAKGENMLGSIL